MYFIDILQVEFWVILNMMMILSSTIYYMILA